MCLLFVLKFDLICCRVRAGYFKGRTARFELVRIIRQSIDYTRLEKAREGIKA